jgi:hypothetical protein
MNDIISSRSCDSGHRTAYSITSSAVTTSVGGNLDTERLRGLELINR